LTRKFLHESSRNRSGGLLHSVLQVVPSVNPGTGGPSASVPGLAAALARAGVKGIVVSLWYSELGAPVEEAGVNYQYVVPSAVGRLLRGWSPALSRKVVASAKTADVVHSHALWMIPGIYARQAAAQFGLPLVISPRGMLDPWALRRSRWRKWVAAAAYENRNLRYAQVIHATSELEAQSIRRYGLRQPIAVLPNGIEIPSAELPPRAVLESRFPELRGKRWLLFLGRLDPKKGVDLLLRIWRDVSSRFPDWQLVIAGPALGGFGARMVATVAGDAVLRGRTTFTGMLQGAEKHTALAHAELSVLPTHGENFGLAIAESLAHGTPAITTTAAPWSDLVDRECGWWVEPVEGLVLAALVDAMSRPAIELAEMGERGRAMVLDKLSWAAIADQWIGVYEWLRTGGGPPLCVREH
jgi:glycosyltransferase involved in cell wall biosynthesis